MAYAGPAGAFFSSAYSVKQYKFCSRSKMSDVVRPQPLTVRPRQIRQMTRLMPCIATMEPHTDHQGHGSHKYGSKLKLPKEVLKRATVQQKLENEQAERATQEAQARVAQAEARAKQALRVCKKGARRSQEVTNHNRLLQAKQQRLARDSDVGQLWATLDGKEEACLWAKEAARIYENKYKVSLEEKEQAAYLKRQALKEKIETQQKAGELEMQRQQSLLWYQKHVNTAKVVSQFVFQLCAKAAASLPSNKSKIKSDTQATDKPEKSTNKGTPRFL